MIMFVLSGKLHPHHHSQFRIPGQRMEHQPQQQQCPSSSCHSHGHHGDDDVFPGSPGVYRRLSEDSLIHDHPQHQQSHAGAVTPHCQRDRNNKDKSYVVTAAAAQAKAIPGTTGLQQQPVMVTNQLQRSSNAGNGASVASAGNTSSAPSLSSSPLAPPNATAAASAVSNHPELRGSQSLQLRTIPHEILRKACSSGSTSIPGMASLSPLCASSDSLLPLLPMLLWPVSKFLHSSSNFCRMFHCPSLPFRF